MKVVGQGLLQAKIAQYLVPTLTESFFLTAAIIFVAYLVVFRSAAARLMAIIPSLFAILVMFLVMRLVQIPLNVATILIASTVLGASENDQIHFFYHFQEKRNGGSTEQALRHTLLIAGRAIVFATLINAGGFLALALSGLPPMRQFGIISASAFVLSMVASFTALPASLWIFFREVPDRAEGGRGQPGSLDFLTTGPRISGAPAARCHRQRRGTLRNRRDGPDGEEEDRYGRDSEAGAESPAGDHGEGAEAPEREARGATARRKAGLPPRPRPKA